MEWLLEIALVVLLAVTLFHALRLERALGVLKRDRVALEELVSSFNSSTRAAEQGIEKLRVAADGAGRQIERQVDSAAGLSDDLKFLMERGNRLADQLDHLIRAGRPLAHEIPHGAPHGALPERRRYAAEPDGFAEPDTYGADPATAAPADGAEPRMRSQAERNLLKALRMAR
jgi:hypothetical protein